MKIKSHLLPILVGIFCLALLLRLGFSSFWLDPYDEPVYLLFSFTHKWLPSWGPLYSVYYRALGLFLQDPIFIYNLNFVLLALGIFLSVYAVVFSLTRSYMISLGAGIFSMATEASLQCYPKIHVFNYCVLILLFFGLHQNTRNLIRLLCFYILLTMSLYIRQDNLIYVIVYLLYDFQRLRSLKVVGPILIVTFFSFFAFQTIWRTSFDSDRTWSAFSDHFAWSIPFYQEYARGQTADLSVSERVSIIFGNAKSLPEALIRRPKLFLSSMFYHVSGLPKALLLGMNLDSTKRASGYIMSFLFWLVLLVLLWIFEKKPDLSSQPQARNIFIPFLIAASFRTLITNCLLSPDSKYMIELALLLPAAAICFSLQKMPLWLRHRDDREKYVFYVFLILGCFYLGSERFRFPIKGGEREINQALIEAMIKHKNKILAAPIAQEAYLHPYVTVIGLEHIKYEQPNESIGHYLTRHSVDIFYVNDEFLDAKRQSGEIGPYEKFFAEHVDWGFEPSTIGIHGEHVYIKMTAYEK